MDDEKESLLQALESTANFLRGMTFDHRLHPEIKAAVIDKVDEIDAVVQAHID